MGLETQEGRGPQSWAADKMLATFFQGSRRTNFRYCGYKLQGRTFLKSLLKAPCSDFIIMCCWTFASKYIHGEPKVYCVIHFLTEKVKKDHSSSWLHRLTVGRLTPNNVHTNPRTWPITFQTCPCPHPAPASYKVGLPAVCCCSIIFKRYADFSVIWFFFNAQHNDRQL